MRGAAGNLSAPIPRVAFSKAGRAEVVPCPRAGAQPPTTRPTRAWALGAPPAELGDAQAENERLKARAEQRARAPALLADTAAGAAHRLAASVEPETLDDFYRLDAEDAGYPHRFAYQVQLSNGRGGPRRAPARTPPAAPRRAPGAAATHTRTPSARAGQTRRWSSLATSGPRSTRPAPSR